MSLYFIVFSCSIQTRSVNVSKFMIFCCSIESGEVLDKEYVKSQKDLQYDQLCTCVYDTHIHKQM